MKPLRFYLRKDDNTYYCSEPPYNEVTTATAANRKEIATPSNWAELELKYARFKDYDGMTRSFALEAVFVLDGKAIIDYVADLEGIEGQLELLIEYWHTSTQTYKPYPITSIDFSEYESEELYTTVAVANKGLHELVKANENTRYDIPITAPDSTGVYNDGTKIRSTYKWVTADQTSIGGQRLEPYAPAPLSLDGEGMVIPMSMINVTQSPYFKDLIYPQTQTVEIVDPRTDTPKDENRFLTTSFNFSGSMVISGTITISPDAATTGNTLRIMLVQKQLSSNTTSSTALYTSPTFGGTLQTLSINTTTNVSFLKDDYNYFVEIWTDTTYTAGSFNNPLITIKGLDASLNVESSTPATTIQGYRYGVAFAKLVSKLTDNKYTADVTALNNSGWMTSNEYNSKPYYEVLASGDSIRGLANADIKLRLADLNKDLKVRHNYGIGIENEKITAKPLPLFYDKNTLIYDFGDDVSEVRTKPFKDGAGSRLISGYPEFTTDDINGKEAFCTKYEYETPLKSLTETMEYTTPFNADPYLIESIRGKLQDEELTDDERDNKVFLLSISNFITTINGVNYRNLQRGGTVTGFEVPNNNIYNVPLSNGRNLMRAKGWFGSLLYKVNNKVIKFTTGERNTDVSSTLPPSPQVSENSDFDLSSITSNDILFQPVVFHFEAQSPRNLFDLMEANPYGYMQFTYKGEVYKGFVISAGMRLGKNDKFAFELLATPDSPTKM